ncbi:hypothetical protein D9M68_18500 [compost metagenome]
MGHDEDSIKITNLCEEITPPGSEETIGWADQFDVKMWIDQFIEAARNHPELVTYIDSMPEVLKKVGDTHVIVPNADNTTEDMLEASRNLLLYTDVFGSLDADYVRKAISRRKWTRDNLPEWFKEYSGHMTKDARADLAYALTLSAAINPPKPEEKYFPEGGHKEQRLTPSTYGFKLSITHGEKILDITREFECWRTRVAHGDMFDLRINRHQLPEYWRKLFKKNAIDVGGVIKKDDADGEVSLETVRVNLGLKNEHAGSVQYTFDKCVKIPKGF